MTTRKGSTLRAVLIGLAAGAALAGALTAGGPPPARTVDVVDERFGEKVADPYRWMEGNDNPELNQWLRAQGDFASAWLERVPGRAALLARIRELGLATSSVAGVQLAGGRAFFNRVAAGEQLPKLVVRERDGSERVLVDPALRGVQGSHASVNAYAPSPDGALLAYDLAQGGGEVSTLRVLDVATGKDLPDVIERVWGEFAASWLPDGRSFFYTQMALPSADRDPMLGMTARRHRLGEPVARDIEILGGGLVPAMKLAPEEFPAVLVQPGTPWMIALAGGAHNEARLAVAPLLGLDHYDPEAWRAVAEYTDSVESFAVHGDRLYLLSFKNASNRRILSLPLARPSLAEARVELAEDPAATIVSLAAARDGLYVGKMVDGRSIVLRLPWEGKPTALALPFDGWVDELATDPLADGALINIEGWTRPGALYSCTAGATSFAALGVASTSTADFSGIVAEEVEAPSADGTRVPLSILHRKDLALDGSHPALLYGYGGYGFSQTPSFNATRLAWLERGGVFAICHVRGGGEKGYRWQADGTHEHKMNGVRDFIGCGQYLIARRYSTASRLSGQAGSMGGILIGRAITERPDLFAAANIDVGIDNPLRILEAENGANQKSELGDPETAAGFKAILAMDPYLHVAPRTAYPAVILTIGLNDRRVAPWMTAKMAARLQASTSSGKPVLVRVEADAGHGIGSTRDQAYAERADVYSFFLAASGEPAFQPKPPD